MNYENSIFTFILQLISLQSTMSLSRDSDNKSNVIWDVSTFSLLWIKLLGVVVWVYIFKYSWCVYPRVELLGQMITLDSTFWLITKLFSQVTTSFYVPNHYVWGFQFIHMLFNTCYYLSFIIIFIPVLYVVSDMWLWWWFSLY